MKSSRILYLNGKHFEFGRSEDDDNKSLPIGGYVSAFFTDLVATYILANITDLINSNAEFTGIYRDNRFIIWEGLRSKFEISDWLKGFQLKVNELFELEKLVFTTEIWKPPVYIKNKLSLLNFNPLEGPQCEVVYTSDDEMYHLDDGILDDSTIESDNDSISSNEIQDLNTQPPAISPSYQQEYNE